MIRLQVYVNEINMKNYIMRDKIKTIVKLYKVSINWSFRLFRWFEVIDQVI